MALLTRAGLAGVLAAAVLMLGAFAGVRASLLSHLVRMVSHASPA